jgi:SAM-dependent methyltransferase
VQLAAQVAQQATVWRRLDEQLFAKSRHLIRTGAWRGAAFRQALNVYTAYTAGQFGQPHYGYDALDLLVGGLFEPEPPPPESQARQPEMVHLERTPARVILELVDRVPLTPADHFYDLGCGLGSVILLFQLLTGVQATGVEIEPAYVAYARQQSLALGIQGVEWLQADARQLDLSAGTVFYLFTPFTGKLLQEVLDRLRGVAENQPITVGTYGSCTRVIAAQPWLEAQDDHVGHEFKLAIFCSRTLGNG